MIGRGNHSEIGTYDDEGRSGYRKGNRVDLCPVGALTSKPNAFQARSWERKGRESLDVMDGRGNPIRRDVRGNQIIRILPGRETEWLGDKSRFSVDGNYVNRVGTNSNLQLTHLDAWIAERMSKGFKGRRSSSMDTRRAKRRKDRERRGSIRFVHPSTSTLTKERRHQGERLVSKALANQEKGMKIEIGLNLKDELPRRTLNQGSNSRRTTGNGEGSNQRSLEERINELESPSHRNLGSSEGRIPVRRGSTVWTRMDGGVRRNKRRSLMTFTQRSVQRVQHRANVQGRRSIGFDADDFIHPSSYQLAIGVDSGERIENGEINAFTSEKASRARRRSSHENWRRDPERKVGRKTSLEAPHAVNNRYGKINWTQFESDLIKEMEGKDRTEERMNDEGIGKDCFTQGIASLERAWNTLRAENRYDYHTEGHSMSRVSVTRSKASR